MNNKRISSLDDHLGYWLRCLSNFVSGSFALRLEGHGISVAQWVVLRTLYDHDALTLNEAAKLVGVDKSSLSRMMERLEQRKLVLRRSNEADGRSVYLSLSATAKKLVPVLAQEADKNDATFFASLSVSERKEFLATIRRLLDANGWDAAARGCDRME